MVCHDTNQRRFKETKVPSMRTHQISKDLIFWFAISVRDPSVLKLTPNTLTLEPFSINSPGDGILSVTAKAVLPRQPYSLENLMVLNAYFRNVDVEEQECRNMRT